MHRQLPGLERRFDVYPGRVLRQAQRVGIKMPGTERGRKQRGRARHGEARLEERRGDQVLDAHGGGRPAAMRRALRATRPASRWPPSVRRSHYDRILQEKKFDIDLEEFSDEIEDWIIQALKAVGCDSARSVLELSDEDLEKRTDLELETIEEVKRILKAEFE